MPSLKLGDVKDTDAVLLTPMVAADLPSSGFLSLGDKYDFRLTYGSTTTVLVGDPGGGTSYAVDSTGAALLSMAGQATVTLTSNGAALGNDSFQGPGTITDASGATVTGTGTTFFTSFGTRAMTGTCSAAGVATVTGTGTKFLSQISVGDLIGNSTVGYYIVSAIASDTSLTLGASLTPTFTGITANCIENPIITPTNTGIPYQVVTIATNTGLGVNQSVTAFTGSNYLIGGLPDLATYPGTNLQFVYLFVGQGASGTTVYASTQRTKPHGITGYNTYFRRIGSLLCYSGVPTFFTKLGMGCDIETQYEVQIVNTNPTTRIVSNQTTGGAWVSVCCATLAPPTAYAVTMLITGTAYFRPRNIGSATTSRNRGTSGFEEVRCPVDGAQWFDFTGSNIYCDFNSYIERL